MGTGIQLAEKGYLSDGLIKFGIRRLLSQRLREVPAEAGSELQEYTLKMIKTLRESPIAVCTEAANEQHYEIPPEFFQIALGKHLKYSSCYYDSGAKNLDDAEAAMLELTAQRAEIKDGMQIMDLGCGWGSFTLWAAKKFPNCTIHSVSNSNPQRLFIEGRAIELGLKNVSVTTADINNFDTEQKYDRIVTVEMFEHIRNYKKVLDKANKWLSVDGKLFVHIFCHKLAPYFFETDGDDNWMGAYFFSGGIMPSNHLLLYFQDQLKIEQHWVVNGTNYEKTALAWLENIDRNQSKVIQILSKTYGEKDAPMWYRRWRIFFLSCAELFGFKDGQEWWVSHYLFKKG